MFAAGQNLCRYDDGRGVDGERRGGRSTARKGKGGKGREICSASARPECSEGRAEKDGAEERAERIRSLI